MTRAAKILIVEDESIVALDIRETLVASGYRVLAPVASAEQALREAEAQRPDLVLMDIRLKGKADGIQAAAKLRREFEIPVVFLSSFADRQLFRQAKEADAFGYVLKPFEERELVAALEMALHRAAREGMLQEALQKARSGDAEGLSQEEEEGEPCAQCPLLKFRTLGAFEVEMEGRKVLGAADLSRSLRELVATLVAAPQMRVEREEVQAALWPESSPQKSRSNFDSLLFRFRKTLEKAVRPYPVGHYLSLRRSILSLNHCRVDAAEFREAVRRGLGLIKAGEYQAAGGLFTLADQLWQGSFLPGMIGGGKGAELRDELDFLFMEYSLRWGRHLAESGRPESAIPVLRKAWRQDRTNDALAFFLYRLYRECGFCRNADQVVRQYAEALCDDDFTREEIEEILKRFKPS